LQPAQRDLTLVGAAFDCRLYFRVTLHVGVQR
jgi:hypothetical protein